jgi:hypothetical protein
VLAAGLLVVVEEFTSDAVISSTPAKTISTMRVGKILRRRIFFVRGTCFLTGTVKL